MLAISPSRTPRIPHAADAVSTHPGLARGCRTPLPERGTTAADGRRKKLNRLTLRRFYCRAYSLAEGARQARPSPADIRQYHEHTEAERDADDPAPRPGWRHVPAADD